VSTVSSAQATVDLVVLFLVLLPLGAALLRLGEWLAGRRFSLLITERIILSFFASGGLLYVCASIPLPIYGLPLVVGLLVAGALACLALVSHDHAKDLGAALRVLLSWPMLAVGLGTLGLLALEISSGSLLLPNGVDGAVHSLFVNLILRNHSIPSTLDPFAADGVIYPLGAPVWMTLPVLLFGWPIVAAPIFLPPLFACLSVAAGFSLGERLSPDLRSRTPWVGLLFAAFFGLIASWPRLYVGGSYDFIFALPLFVVALGLLRAWASTGPTSWRSSLALGLFLGYATALSAAVGVALMLLLGGWILAFHRVPRQSVGSAMLRLLGAVGIAAIFVVRSIVGVVAWFDYPGHVLTPTGSAPYAPLVTHSVYNLGLTQIDPFGLFRWKVSPISSLSVELEVLLVVGIALSIFLLLRPQSALGRYLSTDLVRWVGLSTLILLAETSALLALGTLNGSVSGIQSVTNLWETSVLLFFFYQLIAVLPLVAMTNSLRGSSGVSRASASPPPRLPAVGRRPIRAGVSGWRAVTVVVLLVALGTGGGATVVAVPGYLHSYLLTQANATSSDVAALEWAPAHLPSCSRVLVAPGSAAQFLPEYAVVNVIYPTFPYPTNLSYSTIVTDLTAGNYSNTTRAALTELGVTEIFATGQTTNAFLPFDVRPLENSSDFTVLFAQGDATILVFLPEVVISGCAPVP
jgi:hypothetical protein